MNMDGDGEDKAGPSAAPAHLDELFLPHMLTNPTAAVLPPAAPRALSCLTAEDTTDDEGFLGTRRRTGSVNAVETRGRRNSEAPDMAGMTRQGRTGSVSAVGEWDSSTPPDRPQVATPDDDAGAGDGTTTPPRAMRPLLAAGRLPGQRAVLPERSWDCALCHVPPNLTRVRLNPRTGPALTGSDRAAAGGCGRKHAQDIIEAQESTQHVRCGLCGKFAVPEVVISTVETPPELKVRSSRFAPTFWPPRAHKRATA